MGATGQDFTIRVNLGFAGDGGAQAVVALNNITVAAGATVTSAKEMEAAMAKAQAGASSNGAVSATERTRQAVEKLKQSYKEAEAEQRKLAGDGGSGGSSLLSNIGGGLLGLAGRAGIALSAVSLLKKGFEGFAAKEEAGVELAKFGVNKEDAEKNASILKGLKIFTGDGTEAAQLYGQVINGVVRGLNRYGIELKANAPLEERMNALRQLAALGMAKQAAMNDTLIGSLTIFGKGLTKMAVDAITWVVNMSGVSKAIGWVNEALGFAGKKSTEATPKIKGFNAALDETAGVAGSAEEATKRASAALEDIGSRAAAATTKLDAMQTALDKVKGKEEDLDDLRIKQREAEGEDAISIAKAKMDLEQKRAGEERENTRQWIARTRAEVQEASAHLDDVQKRQNAGPTEKRLTELQAKENQNMPALYKALQTARAAEAKSKSALADAKKNPLAEENPDDPSLPWLREMLPALQKQREAGLQGDLTAKSKAAEDALEKVQSSGLSKDEIDERTELLKSREAERAAIASERSKLEQAKQSADKLEADLPKRQEAAEIKRKTSEASIQKMQDDRDLEAARKREQDAEAFRQRALAENAPADGVSADPFDDLGAFGRRVAKHAQPERRKALEDQAGRIESGGATEGDIDAFQKAAGDVLQKRSELRGKRGDDAKADTAELQKLADAARKTAAEAAKFAPLIKESMEQMDASMKDANKAIADALASFAASKRQVQGAN